MGKQCAPPPPPRETMYRAIDEGDLATADQIMNDMWPVPRYQPVQLPPPDQLTWLENPYNDKYWRFEFYSFRPASNLLWAFRQTGDTRYRDKLMAVFESFAAKGLNSPFTVDRHTSAFRAMVITNAYYKLKRLNALSPSEDQMMLGLAQATGNFLVDPKHFEPNFNHGINESNALLLVAENFPNLPGAAQWGATARSRLESLMTTAVGPDGVANEMSPYYHFYIVDALAQTLAWSEANLIDVSPKIAPTVAGMVRYGTYIMQPDGNVPMIAACLARNVPTYDQEVFRGIRSENPDFDYVMTGGREGTEPQNRLILFNSANHAILRSAFGPPKNFKDQTHVFLDMSPYRTAQSQLDALNVVVYSAGRTLITDSGLYTYLAGPDRSYFIGTRAHNTVVVDGLDQNQGAAVVGLSKSTPTWLYQSGSHTLYAGVTHRRAVVLLQKDVILIVDQLESGAPHTYEQTWHFQPDMDVAVTGTDLLGSDLNGPNIAIHQAFPAGLTVTTVKGVMAPVVDGWYSEEYGIKFPSWSAKYAAQATSTNFATLLATGPYASQPASVTANATATGTNATVCVHGTGWDVAITNLAQPGEDVQVTPASCP